LESDFLLKTELLSQSNSVLVLVDIQQRLVEAMPDTTALDLIKSAQILSEAAHTLAVPILVTEQYPKGLGATVTELKSTLDDCSIIIEKTHFSCAKVEAFAEYLESSGRKQVILAGMESHICILQTALDLQAQGFQVYVIEDAVCSRTNENKKNALQRLQQANVVITNVESTLFEWLGDARHPDFKAVSKLIV